MANKDKSNSKLKFQSKSWWSKHSQDYVNPGQIDHLGIKKNISDIKLKNF